ncbi:MAG: hypothetical protein WBV22_03800 [Anaerolineaceae bacterium]
MNRKQLSRIVSVILIIVCALSTSAGGGGVRWKTIRVDAGTTINYLTNSSLKLYDGVPSVAYGGDHLYYASLVGSNFVTTTVDANWGVGMYASLALEPSTGHPRISYSDDSYHSLKYAEQNSVGPIHTWTTTTVDLNGADEAGNKTAIALDTSNLPHIAYTKQDRHVWHAWKACAGCSWSREEVDGLAEVSGRNISLAIDGNGHLHLVYYNEITSTLQYAVNNGSWYFNNFVVDSGLSGYHGVEPSLVLTSGNAPAIAYADGTSIKYAQKTGLYPWNWSISTVYDDSTAADDPNFPSLQLPNDDATQPWISFIDGDGYVSLATIDEGGSLPVCPGTDGDFGCQSVDNSSIFDGSISMVVETGAYNLSRLIYLETITGELRYGTETSQGNWTDLPVDYSSNTGLSSSLALDASGPHIAYYDTDKTNFSFAEFDGSDPGINCGEYRSNDWFRCDVISNNAMFGSQASVGIGYDTYPHVALYDRSLPILRYATLNTSWDNVIVDMSSENIGLFPSLAFSPDTLKAVIAYLDVTNGHLMIAKELPSPTGNCPSTGGYWQCDIIEDVGPDTTGISLAFGYQNKPVISYIDGIEHLAKVARYSGPAPSTPCTNAFWSCESIAPGHTTSYGQTSIWADPASSVIMVSFYNSDGIALMLSTFSLGGGWVHEYADNAMYSGMDNSLTVVGTTMPVIAYSGHWEDLNIAYKVGSGNGNCGEGMNWYCEVLDFKGRVGYYPSIKLDPSGRIYISYYDLTNGDLKLTFQALPSFLPLVKKP